MGSKRHSPNLTPPTLVGVFTAIFPFMRNHGTTGASEKMNSAFFANLPWCMNHRTMPGYVSWSEVEVQPYVICLADDGNKKRRF